MKPNKHDVIFFERNGLRLDRMDFSLRDNAKIIGMAWNSSSDIFALGLQLLPDSEKSKVSFFTHRIFYMRLLN